MRRKATGEFPPLAKLAPRERVPTVAGGHTVILSEPAVVLSEPTVILSKPTVILSKPTVILSKPTVILSKPTVILSEAKDLPSLAGSAGQ